MITSLSGTLGTLSVLGGNDIPKQKDAASFRSWILFRFRHPDAGLNPGGFFQPDP